MSMRSVEEIASNYKKYDDAKIEHIAHYEVRALREDVIPILVAEIERRDLDTRLIDWVYAERRVLIADERVSLVAKVKACVCTNCEANSNLEGFYYKTMVGMLVLNANSENHRIYCTDCRKQRLRKSMLTTLVFGWFSFLNLLRMPFVLFGKIKDIFQRESRSEAIINTFIDEHIGLITLQNDDAAYIQELLDNFNVRESILTE